MSSRGIDKTIKISAKDETMSTWLGMARTIRTVSSLINQMISLTRILIIAQTGEGISVTRLMAQYTLLRYAKIAAALAGLGAGGIALAALVGGVAAGGGFIPVAQTMPGQSRIMRATAPVMAHQGEIISRPQRAEGIAAGGLGGGGIVQNFNVATNNPDWFAASTANRLKSDLRALTFHIPR